MNELKYIVVLLNGMTTESAILFRGSITHSTVVPPECKVVGAGFCTVKASGGFLFVTCRGGSESLEIESRPKEDADAIEAALTKMHSYSEY